MVDHIVSVDAGNGGTNAVLLNPNGSYKYHYEPSVRAMATGNSLDIDHGLLLQYNYVDWYGNRYITGDDVLRVTKRGLERHTGVNRYGEEFHRFLVALALAKLGIKKGSVDLVLFAPPGLYNEARQKILNGFTGQNGQIQISISGDKKPRSWEYNTITMLPEGIGAAACFLYDEQGAPAHSDTFDGEVVILDIGAFTLDALKMVDGGFNVEDLEEATWENAGINTHIREPLLRKIRKQGDDFSVVTVDDVDAVLRRGLESNDYSLTVAGYQINLGGLAENYFERYADWIANNICDGVFNGFRGIKSVILAGGGAVMVGDKLRELYPEKILNPKKYAHVRKVHPVYMNAVGGLRFALAMQQETVG